MRVKEFSNYRAPKRRPWVAIVLVLLLVLVVVWVIRKPRREEPVAEELEPIAEQEQRVPDSPRQTRGAAASVVPPVAVALPAEIAGLLARAEEFRKADRLQEAREVYQQALAQTDREEIQSRIEEALGAVHIALILSPRQMPEKIEYVVRSGDSLGLIAARQGTTVALLQQGNRLANPNLIKAGDRLRVFTGAFEIVVSKPRRDLVVLMNGDFFKRYRVGTGVYGKTPVGTFVIRDKIPEPSWWPPDGREVPFGHPDNILGTRWMSIRATGDTPNVRGYGIHGTWEPDSIGHELSAGCIRMINEQVEELFVYIPNGTPVTIKE